MPPRVTLVCGQSQQGKSTLALWLALREYPRVIALDLVRTKPFAPIAPAFTDWPDMARWLSRTAPRHARWCVALRTRRRPDYVSALAAAPHYRGLLLLCDETPRLCTIPGALDPLIECAQVGAHFGDGAGVALLLVAQRPMNVPPDVRSQVERVVSFRQKEAADLSWVSGHTTPEFAAQLAELPDHHWLSYPPDPAPTPRLRPDVEDDRHHGGRGRDSGGRGPDVPEVQPDQPPPGREVATATIDREDDDHV